jgi:ADP-ribose pyrophosphatase YjhB (NUDIX family)
MRIGPKKISDAFYKKIVESVPIVCVDIVVRAGKEFILVKRKDEPARGEWWLIGGRLIKGERLKQAVIRKVREELGVRSAKIKRFITTRETMFARSFWGVPTHTVNSVFVVEIKRNSEMRKDKTVQEAQWFSKINNSWPAYVKEMLQREGFK